MGEQQAAEHRADGHADADRGGPDADGAGPLAGLEDVGDDGQRLRHDGRAAQAHHRAGRDELVGRVRVGREQRAEAEQHEAGHQHALAADPVADDAEGEQQAGEDERVGVDRPLKLGLAGAEAARSTGLAMVLSATLSTVLSMTMASRPTTRTPRMTHRLRCIVECP